MLSISPSWKVTFPVTQKPTPPTVFNLQASDWVHCEEETGAYYQLSRFTYKLIFKKKLLLLRKKYTLFKKFPKFIILFFSKRDNWAYIYMYWMQWWHQIYYISKILGGVVFCMSAPKHLFFTVDRKSSQTKTFPQNIYMFSLYNFSVKCIIKKNHLLPYGPLNF